MGPARGGGGGVGHHSSAERMGWLINIHPVSSRLSELGCVLHWGQPGGGGGRTRVRVRLVRTWYLRYHNFMDLSTTVF